MPAPLPTGWHTGIPQPAKTAVIAAATDLVDHGRWPLFGKNLTNIDENVDWFLDPLTGRRAPDTAFAFSIQHRDEARVGNIKGVWELSRHHHLTFLATAYALTGDDRFADRAATSLRAWCEANPFLGGVHWTSGIEVGLRLIAWVWLRRLLADWPPVASWFENDPTFVQQLHDHQRYIAALYSVGSSANNHLIAEAAGQFAAASAFPWFAESSAWRDEAASILKREAVAQTFPSGLNRELATDYHGFVLELLLAAAIEGEAADASLGDGFWADLCRMLDALAAVVDSRLHPPRQGDSDEGIGLLLDAPDYNRWASLLATGETIFGALPWWPVVQKTDIRTHAWRAMAGRCPKTATGRPAARPASFPDAGVTILRSPTAPEIWCKGDHGPHGFLAIAAHAHSDALSIELRHDGVEVLADAGTYCYHGEPEWRDYFRSTRAHNTLELAGANQSEIGGPFMWTRAATTTLHDLALDDDLPVVLWTASHDGYRHLPDPATHTRTVRLHRTERWLEIIDSLEGEAEWPCCLAFLLGPEIDCKLEGTRAELAWDGPSGRCIATISLPSSLTWQAARAATTSIAGWYSPGFAQKRPAWQLLGMGRVGGGQALCTTLQFEAPALATARRPMTEHTEVPS